MMNEITRTSSNAVVPVAKVEIAIRLATLADVPFMDSMQKKFGRQLGYFPTKQFEGYVEMGAVLLAESNVDAASSQQSTIHNRQSPTSNVDGRMSNVDEASYQQSTINNRQSPTNPALQQSTINNRQSPTPVGYVISRDRYLKRDELGVIYQLCVAPGTQRKLVGASLIAEVFRRSAYGCKLYCCWCAQDIDANYFWESIGFVPIAFRAGGKQKANPSTGLRAGRVHIFWQRRVHAEDVVTPWWYPCATNGGAIREDRLVFPIPPGVSWRDVTSVVVPGAVSPSPLPFHPPRVRGDLRGGERESAIVVSRKPKAESRKPKLQNAKEETPGSRQQISTGRLFFGTAGKVEAAAKTVGQKKPRAPKVRVKNDPALVAKARELRDRWMEQLNSAAPLLGEGKYDVGRVIDTDKNVGGTKEVPAAREGTRLLPAA